MAQLENRHPPSVLLVEDDDIDAMAIQRALKRAELELGLVRATSAEEALRVLRGEAPKKLLDPFVVLLDLNMPGMGGHEFLAELRSDERLAKCVVFVLTTSGSQADIERAYSMQVAGYFVKEIDSGRNEQVTDLLRAYFAACRLPGEE